MYACSTPLYSGGTWYISAYRPNIRCGFFVSPGKYQDCFLPHPLQLFTSYHLTIYSLSYSEYHEINCEYAKVRQVVSGLPFFSHSHPTLHNAAKKKCVICRVKIMKFLVTFFLSNVILNWHFHRFYVVMCCRQLNLPQIQRILQEFEKQSEIMDMKEEMMNDAIDDAMEDEGDEEER